LTRLPSNLRPTTREYVHYEWSLQAGHVSKKAVTPFDPPYPKNPCCTQTSWLCFIADGSFTLWEVGFSTFFLQWPWSRPENLHTGTWPRIPSRSTGCTKILRQGCQKLSSGKHTHIQRDRQTRPKVYTTLLRGW